MSSPPLPRRPPRTRRRKHLIAEHLPRLAESARGLARDEKLVREMVETCLKLLRNGTPVGDIKILNAALRELRYAFKVFAPYRNVRKVSVFGSARSARESSACRTAFEFAQRIRDAGYMVITGAGHGIMGACQEGAGPDHSFGVNIRLPFEQGPNEVIAKDPKLLTFRYFFTRKLIFIKEADAAALFPGGFGTHDEAYECLTLVQTGKTKPMPIVFLDAPRGTYWKTWKRYVEYGWPATDWWRRPEMPVLTVRARATALALLLCAALLSLAAVLVVRTVDRNLVIRLTHRIPESLVTQLGHDFADIVVKGEIVQTGALEEEREDAPELVRLPRLVLEFNRSSFGRLRQLIDRLNSDG